MDHLFAEPAESSCFLCGVAPEGLRTLPFAPFPPPRTHHITHTRTRTKRKEPRRRKKLELRKSNARERRSWRFIFFFLPTHPNPPRGERGRSTAYPEENEQYCDRARLARARARTRTRKVKPSFPHPPSAASFSESCSPSPSSRDGSVRRSTRRPARILVTAAAVLLLELLNKKKATL